MLLSYVLLKDKKAYGPIMEEWYKSPSKVLEEATAICNIYNRNIQRTSKDKTSIYKNYISKGTTIEIEKMLTIEALVELKAISEEDTEDNKPNENGNILRNEDINNRIKRSIKYKI